MVAILPAAMLHGAKKFLDTPTGLGNIRTSVFKQIGKNIGRQQILIFGKHAEQTLHQKVSHLLAIKPPRPH